MEPLPRGCSEEDQAFPWKGTEGYGGGMRSEEDANDISPNP